MSSSNKFCKVCQQSGKSEAVYKSHYVRASPDPNSKVVCPTLLALECRHCRKKGHTIKYCFAAKNSKNTTTIKKPEPIKVNKPVINNVFDLLNDTLSDDEKLSDQEEEEDSDEEEEEQVVSTKPTYSDMLKKPLEQEPIKPKTLPLFEFINVKPTVDSSKILNIQRTGVRRRLDWADSETDSDDDLCISDDDDNDPNW